MGVQRPRARGLYYAISLRGALRVAVRARADLHRDDHLRARGDGLLRVGELARGRVGARGARGGVGAVSSCTEVVVSMNGTGLSWIELLTPRLRDPVHFRHFRPLGSSYPCRPIHTEASDRLQAFDLV